MARAMVGLAGALVLPAMLLAGCGGGGGGGGTSGASTQTAGASGASASGTPSAGTSSSGDGASTSSSGNVASPVATGTGTTPVAAGSAPASTGTSGTGTSAPAVQAPAGGVALAGGGWVTTTLGGGTTTTSIAVQRYDAAGARAGAAIEANTSGAAVDAVHVVPLADGGFAVTWLGQGGSFRTVYGYDLPLVFVYARHFDAAGQALGGVVQVSSGANYHFTTAVPTALANGGYVILWSTDTSYPNIPGYRTPNIDMRRMASNGTAMTAEALVFDTYGQPLFTVTPAADGGFTIDWQRQTPGGTTPYTRSYDPQGNPTGPAVAGPTTPVQ